ncbi:MAG: MBL fold metallo-hydrolase [Deltaproteobacteria bacterium]|nr:MBL fold metallo-hydrolase [Deltaproteobacteria bacterium]
MSEVLFIGTGDAFNSGGRRNSAILVREHGRTLLLDCGPTTLAGLSELGVDPLEIDAIALSHFHGDHIAGVPFLLLDYQYQHPRDRPLSILGPPGVADSMAALTRAYGYHVEQQDRYALRFAEFSIDKPTEVAGFRVTPMPALHQEHTCPHMVRVDAERRSLVFSGDTGWHDELPKKVGDVDLFISECVFFDTEFAFHLSHQRLDRERARFECGAIRLTHLGHQVLSNESQVRFDTAHDGLRLIL